MTVIKKGFRENEKSIGGKKEQEATIQRADVLDV